MKIQLFGVGDFLAMLDRKAALIALAEKQTKRTEVYDQNYRLAIENGVDETVVHLYAQCALDDFDKRNIQ